MILFCCTAARTESCEVGTSDLDRFSAMSTLRLALGDSSASHDPFDCERGFVGVSGRVFSAVFANRTSLDPAGEAVAGDVAARVLFDPLRTPVDGEAGV